MEMKNKTEEMRKGPWTEQEDVQLVFYVNLFGDRRWDFVAKVSGLKRTGKSCRLRWVNYLHPGLKRGKMTPHEERLVLDLHKRWGNRWSRIARKLPGRTDNEIKNYWRTHMRKQAQEKKKAPSQSSSCSNSSSSSTSECGPAVTQAAKDTKGPSFFDTGGKITSLEIEDSGNAYSMDEIWKDIELSEGSSRLSARTWDFCGTESLWSVDDEDHSKMLMQQMGDYYYSFPFSTGV